ncbi:MAG: type II methionyl aminopeptidase [Candidatus Diapherotrites archaeon]|nr:type II methionyl aminopeptidase [Candidatus Diapherotrites archaeon]
MEGEKEYIKAGKILREVLELARKKAKPGMKHLELAQYVESKVKELGGEWAFPCNISANEVAAHDTPAFNDERTIPENSVVKIDMGVHINGYIADAAFTVDFSGENGKLIEATEMALQNAISILKPGIDLSLIGKEIETTIKSYGMKPIHNLGGHNLGKYKVHAGLNIPNIHSKEGQKLPEEGGIAIEPFATNGDAGYVIDTNEAQIMELVKPVSTRLQAGRVFLERAEKFKGLPFAERWVVEGIRGIQLNTALRELIQKEALKLYPSLKERSNGLISQTEKSMILIDGDVKVIV